MASETHQKVTLMKTVKISQRGGGEHSENRSVSDSGGKEKESIPTRNHSPGRRRDFLGPAGGGNREMQEITEVGSEVRPRNKTEVITTLKGEAAGHRMGLRGKVSTRKGRKQELGKEWREFRQVGKEVIEELYGRKGNPFRGDLTTTGGETNPGRGTLVWFKPRNKKSHLCTETESSTGENRENKCGAQRKRENQV